MELKFTVSGDRLRLKERESVISGNANSYICVFELDKSYEELLPFAVFGFGDETFTVEIENGSCIMPHEAISESGIVKIGVFATGTKNGEFMRISTNIVGMNVESGAFSVYSVPKTPDLWEKYFTDIKIFRNQAEEFSIISEEAKVAAENSASMAKQSEENAAAYNESAKNYSLIAETSADDAYSSEKMASQVLKDLLKMINSGDIVLAENGVLPLSAIPATATHDVFVIQNESELTSLNAQKGDLAELCQLIDGEKTVTKTWQCLGDNPKIRGAWVVWGTSYAVRSGFAEMTETAKDSLMLNGHRIVVFKTMEEYENAAKEDNTVYLVGEAE